MRGPCLNKVLQSSSGGGPCRGDTNWKGKESGKGCSHGWDRRASVRLEAVACTVHPRTAVGLPGVHWPRSPSFSPQSSQPSTTSPFKQEVFVYSPSPSTESPSLGAAATPIIMSRSPTGQWHAKMCMMWLEGQSCSLTAVQRACPPPPGMLTWPTSPFPRCEGLTTKKKKIVFLYMGKLRLRELNDFVMIPWWRS